MKPTQKNYEALYGSLSTEGASRLGELATFQRKGERVSSVIAWAFERRGALLFVLEDRDPSSSLPYLISERDIIATRGKEPTMYPCSCGQMHPCGVSCIIGTRRYSEE